MDPFSTTLAQDGLTECDQCDIHSPTKVSRLAITIEPKYTPFPIVNFYHWLAWAWSLRAVLPVMVLFAHYMFSNSPYYSCSKLSYPYYITNSARQQECNALLLFCSSALLLFCSSALLLFCSSALLLFCSSALLLWDLVPSHLSHRKPFSYGHIKKVISQEDCMYLTQVLVLQICAKHHLPSVYPEDHIARLDLIPVDGQTPVSLLYSLSKIPKLDTIS